MREMKLSSARRDASTQFLSMAMAMVAEERDIFADNGCLRRSSRLARPRTDEGGGAAADIAALGFAKIAFPLSPFRYAR